MLIKPSVMIKAFYEGGNKTDKKNYYNSLKWPIEQYPKRIINTTPKLQDSFDDSIDWDMYD